MIFKSSITLEKFHLRGLGHFDVKEKNIFIIEGILAIKGDLGLTRVFDYKSNKFGPSGTPIYLGVNVDNQITKI